MLGTLALDREETGDLRGLLAASCAPDSVRDPVTKE